MSDPLPPASSLGAPDDSSSGDELDPLLIECMERLARGEPGAIEAACAEAPERAQEIRERMGLLLQMGLVKDGVTVDDFPEHLDQFRLVRRLGGGGMGVVYEAEQEPLGRLVALKLIRPEQLYFPRARERFRRETEAVAKLQHSGIVAIYTVGEAQGIPYFAMERLEGATLGEVLTRVAGRAPESLRGRDLLATLWDGGEPGDEARELFAGSWVDACTRIVARVADALSHAHSRGVLHRDVKPSNILLTPQGRVVLLDFGLASSATELRMTLSGSAVGSVLYMAPEQLKGRVDEIDERTDVYALGVTLYELVTLQVPFFGEDAERARSAILDGRPTSMRARNRGVSRDLEVVCTTAIERERPRRYASMELFARDLRNALERRPIAARPPGAGLRALRWVQRNPTTSVALAAAVVLALGVPLALFWQERGHSLELQAALEAQTAARRAADEASALAAFEKERAEIEAQSAERVATFLVDLFRAADPNRSRGRDVSARDLLQRGVERIEAQLDDQPEILARLLDRLGQSFTNLDLYGEALPVAERALALQCSLPGADGVRTAQMALSLGKLRRLSGIPDALGPLQHSLGIFRACVGPDDRMTLQCEAEFAIALCEQNRAAEASTLLERALAVQARVHPRDLELREKLLAAWMVSLSAQRRFVEVERVAREALEIAFEVYRGPHPAIVGDLNGLANALAAQGRGEEAAETFEDVLALARLVYGEASATYVYTRMNQAVLLEQLGRLGEAERIYREALAWLTANLGAEHPNAVRCLGNLTHVLTRSARYGEIVELSLPALDLVRARVGPSAERTQLIAYRAAEAYEALGQFERAEELLRNTLTDAGRLDRRRTAWIEITLAGVLRRDTEQRDEARAILTAIEGRCIPMLQRQVLHHLACLELAENDADAADAWLARARALPDPTLDDGWAGPALHALSSLRAIDEPDLDRGAAEFNLAIRELEKVLGARHVKLIELLELAERACSDAGDDARASALRQRLAELR